MDKLTTTYNCIKRRMIMIRSRIRFQKEYRPKWGSVALFIFVTGAIFWILVSSSTSASWMDNQWKYRKKMLFNNSGQSTNLTDFPVMIALDSTNFDFTQTQANGYDIRFTDSDGTTLIYYERELFSVTDQKAIFWVKVPQINASSNSDYVYMYWGNSNAPDGSQSGNVWGSNYKGVYHLDDNAAVANAVDSTGYANNLTTDENVSTGFYTSSGIIGGAFQTAGNPDYVQKTVSTVESEVYPDVVLDSNDYPVIAYYEQSGSDLVLIHCNDRECKGHDESYVVLDSAGSTGAFPSIVLDGSGNPVIAYTNSSLGDLMLIHCGNANCTAGNVIATVDSTNTTGSYPDLVLDGSGNPVIAYYYASGADVYVAHCGNANCTSGNSINALATSGTLGNYLHSIVIRLDASGYPYVVYGDATNLDLVVAHCNDANCAGGNETINTPLSASANNTGTYTKGFELDASGKPMIVYFDLTTTYTNFLHCDDVNCAGDESANVTVVTTTTMYFTDMHKTSAGIPIIVGSLSNVYPRVFVCSDTNCSSTTQTYLATYNQYSSSYPSMDLSSNDEVVYVGYVRGRSLTYDTHIYTTQTKIKRSYDSDLNFGTGNFSVSTWFKSSGKAENNYILSRYDTDQGFKIWSNYGGRICFGIDDDSTWNPDDSACSTNTNIITNVDNGHATGVSWHDMVLDGSGYPVIAYYDANSGQLDLELIHCNDANCTGNDEGWGSIDTTGDVGQGVSLILDGNGYPVMAYHDNTNQDLKVAHCGNANCTSGNVVNTVDSTGDVGDYPTIKLDTSGYPVISYYDTTNTAVKLVHCNDVNCSGGNESIVTLVNDEDDRVRHGTESLQLDGSGYPVVVYSDLTNYDLKIIHCNDVNCVGSNETKATIDTAGTVGDFASMKLDSSGYPVIAYYDGTNLNLKLAHCGNANCSSGNNINTVNGTNFNYADNGYFANNIAINSSNGYPVIVSTQLASFSATLIACNDINCAGDNETISIIREDPYSYQYTDLVLDGNRYPVITFTRSSGDLQLIHLSNTTTYTETGTYDDGNWHHLVAVKSGTSSIRLYIDGAEVGSDVSLAANGTLTSDSAELHLGEDYQNGLSISNWTGYLDEVQIDNTARTADWVKAQYLSESNQFVNIQGIEMQGNPVGYYAFDDQNPPLAHNSVWQKSGTTTNLELNPSLETNDTGWSGWNNSGSATRERTNELALFGDYSFKQTCTADGNQEGDSYGGSIQEGKTYTVSFWVNVPTVGSGESAPFYYRIYYDGGNSILGTIKTITAPTNGWIRYSQTQTIPAAGHTNNSIQLSFYTNKAGTVVYVDGVQIEESANTTTYCDGSLIGNGSHVWNGTAHGSSSTCDAGTDADIMDGVTYQPSDQCISGTCVGFNGSNGMVIAYDSPSDIFDQPDAMSIEAWIRPIDAGQNSYGRVIVNVSGVDLFVQNLSGNTLNFCAQTNGTTDTCSSNLINLNEWNHVAIVYTDNNTRSFYINGKLDKTNDSTNTLINSSADKIIGNIAAGGRAFHGNIDEVRIFGYARSTSQIRADYSAGKSQIKSSSGSAVVLGGSTNGSDALTSQLTGYWKVDETASPAVDSSGNNNSGTWAGTTAAYQGRYGNSALFDGNSDYIEAADSDSLTMSNAFTFSTWVYQTGACATDCIIFNKENDYEWRILNGTVSYAIRNTSPGWAWVSTGITVSATTWTHLVLTYDSTEQVIRGYKNGELLYTRTSSTGSLSDYGTPFRIAARNAPGAANSFFAGALDEVRIYKSALTPAQVKDLYEFSPDPVGYWKLDENQGNKAYDSTTSHLNSTLYSGTTWDNGKYGGGFTFNGTTGYATIPDSNLIDFNYDQNFSVMAWIKVPSAAQQNLANSDNCIIEKWDVNGSYSYVFRYYNTDHHLYVYRYDGSHVPGIISTNTYNDDQFHHVAFIKSGSTLYLYIDGKLDGTTTDTTTTTTTNNSALYLGMRGNNANYFTGSIDDLRIYNYARTSGQILEDINGGKSPVSTSGTSQVLYWKFDDGYDTTAHDSSQNHLDGTLGNMPATAWTNDGRFNKGLSFAGAASDDYVYRSDNTLLDVKNITIDLWAKIAATTGTWQVFAWKNTAYELSTSNTLHPRFGITNGSSSRITCDANSTTLPLNDWFEMTMTYDGSKIRGYVNGIEVASCDQTGDIINNASAFSVSDTSYEVNGIVDEVSIYPAAFTAEQVRALTNHSSSVQLGSNWTNPTGTPSNSAGSEYCVTGSTESCNAPIAEWKFDQTSGSTIYDSSGNNYTGSWSGTGVHWDVVGKNGNAITTNGSDDYVTVTNSAVKLTGAHTYEFWLNPTSWTNLTNPRVFGGIDFTAANGLCGVALGYYTATNTLYYDTCSTTVRTAATFGSSYLPVGTWTHIALTYDGTSSATAKKVYINGVLVSTGTGLAAATYWGNSQYFYIGNNAPTYGNVPFNGKFDDFRVFDYARSSAQVAWDYNRGKPAGWWKLDECQDTIAHDSSILGNNGTISIGGGGGQSSVGNCDTTGTAWGNGKSGKINASLNFDGSDDNIYSNITASNGLDITGPISYSAWFKRANNGTYQTIVGKLDSCSVPLNGFILRFTLTNNLSFEGYKTNIVFGLTYTNSTLFNDTTNWHHVVATWDGTTNANGVKIYIDGLLVTQGISTADTFTSLVGYTQKIGSLSCNAHYFNGQIDEVQVYSYTLSPNQVKQLFNNGAVHFGN